MSAWGRDLASGEGVCKKSRSAAGRPLPPPRDLLRLRAMSDSGFTMGFIAFWLLGSVVAAAISWGHDWSLVLVDSIMGWIYVAANLAGGVS